LKVVVEHSKEDMAPNSEQLERIEPMNSNVHSKDPSAISLTKSFLDNNNEDTQMLQSDVEFDNNVMVNAVHPNDCSDLAIQSNQSLKSIDANNTWLSVNYCENSNNNVHWCQASSSCSPNSNSSMNASPTPPTHVLDVTSEMHRQTEKISLEDIRKPATEIAHFVFNETIAKYPSKFILRYLIYIIIIS
jgi:hypothetical protein